MLQVVQLLKFLSDSYHNPISTMEVETQRCSWNSALLCTRCGNTGELMIGRRRPLATYRREMCIVRVEQREVWVEEGTHRRRCFSCQTGGACISVLKFAPQPMAARAPARGNRCKPKGKCYCKGSCSVNGNGFTRCSCAKGGYKCRADCGCHFKNGCQNPFGCNPPKLGQRL